MNYMLDYIHICVFHISKNCFEKLARHLLDAWWIDRESSCLLDSSSTPGGLIELLFLNLILGCSIPSRYLSCRALLKGLYILPIVILLSFLQSLSICLRLFISQTLSFSLQNLFLKVSSSFFKFFLHLVSF